jgi:hypothetical protein
VKWSKNYDVGGGSKNKRGNDLNFNEIIIDKESMKKILNYLKTNPKIESLNVKSSRISDDSVLLLFEYLKTDVCLKRINVFNTTKNFFERTTVLFLEKILQYYNSTLVKIYSNNKLTSSIELFLSDNLNNNEK